MLNNVKHSEIIQQMTLVEKASLMSGANFWNTKAIDRLQIPAIMLTDGPHGLRKQGGKADHLGLNKSLPATCFPTAATLANSWDVDLLEEVGVALGRESAYQGVSVLLGPGLNIKRNPLAGRNFEYFSEDPYLTGKLAAAMTRGIQSQGVSACPKHYAVNSQETRRMMVDEIVDERALHEIYLEGFRRLVREANPWTIMTSYNKVNGEYANENQYLVKETLIDRFGYEGVLVTDWGGNNDRVKGLRAGNTLEMPSTNGMTDKEIVSAVEAGELEAGLLDEQVDKLLTLIEQVGAADLGTEYYGKKVSQSETDSSDHIASLLQNNHEKAMEAATRSIVLLKNEDQVLPLKKDHKRIAIIGDFAEKPRYQGAGSSLIEPTQLSDLKSSLMERNLNIIGYEKGFHRLGRPSRYYRNRALALAKKADTVLLFLGLDEGSEAEGVDRKDMKLSKNQLMLFHSLLMVQKNIIVILAGGSPVEMPFAKSAKAILHGYLPGQGGGEAIARVLLGDYNPSGKLAETYPFKYEDVASSSYYPGEILMSEHRESIYIGYRQYDYQKKAVLYPFGYGLSYTTFEYSNLVVEQVDMDVSEDMVGHLPNQSYKVKLTVTNTGQVQGEEVVQLYVKPKNRRVFSEVKSLKAFCKVALNPGEKREIVMTLDQLAFAYFNIEVDDWVTERGHYDLQVGASSRDIRLRSEIYIEGVEPTNPYVDRNIEAYDQVKDLQSSDFEALLGRQLPARIWEHNRELTEQDLLEQSQFGGAFGRFLYRLIMFVHVILRKVGRPIPSNNVLFVMGMPFRSVARMSGGRVNMQQLKGILQMVNGHFVKGIVTYVRNWRK